MFILILSLLILIIGVVYFFKGPLYKEIAGPSVFVVGVFILLWSCMTTVPVGHVKVATIFGKAINTPYSEGLHFVNPLYEFHSFDIRQKTHKETAAVPSEDKLTTVMDVSIQYRTIDSMAVDILKNTGSTQDLINIHLIPKLRSILREQGKGVEKSQDFFLEHIQSKLQISLKDGLREFLQPKGIYIDSVLIRKIELPKIIRDSIAETKKREQEVLLQQAELERFAMQQDKKIKQAESELAAAKLEAQKVKELADAEAYKIDMINKQLSKSPNYIKLKQVEQWNGVLPVYAGGENVPMIDLRSTK